MRTPSRVLRLLGVTGMLIAILATNLSAATAQQDLPGTPGMDSIFDTSNPSFKAGVNSIYFPWVANDDNFGLGDADTSISIQNLEDRDSQIWVYTGNGDNTWKLAASAYLSRYASKTFTAAQLGIASGSGAPVAVMAFNVKNVTDVSTALIETQVLLSKPAGVAGDFTQVVACVVNEHVNNTIGNPYPFTAAVSFSWNGTTYAQGAKVPWTNQAQLQEILNAANAGNTGALINPFGGLNADGDCSDRIGEVSSGTVSLFDAVAIGGVAKQAAGGESLPYTTAADTSVSGYNAINGHEVYRFNEWYLPIVQTNCGPGGCWDSMLRVANLSNLNSAITVRFFPANDGSGSLQTGFQVQQLVNGGDTWHISLGDLVPEGWVGSAHIYSDGAVFAMVDRYKVGYNMWLTNTGSAADFENVAQVPGSGGKYALFAPHVLMDYFGWNTGINVANLYNGDNNVSIQYFNMLGNATQVLNQRLAPHGMTYFYDPSQAPQNNSGQDPATDPNSGVVGSAVIWSDHPVAAAIDATKYPESDPRGGVDVLQGTSYSATQNVFTWQAVPLVQKGNPADGSGATSGINIMNPNATAATANVYWVNPSGFNAQNFGVSSVTIPAFANGFVYTMTQHNLPNGFYGAAQVVSNIPVAAVSANVDYQVDGDGSAIFNAVNPCGLYRVTGPCSFGDPLDVTGRSVTKTFIDHEGQPVPGVTFSIVGNNPAFPYQRDGVSGPEGSRLFTNVPAGDYELHVTTVPAGYLLPVNPADVFTVTQGKDVVLVNTLYPAQGFEKYVCVADYDLDSCSDVWLSGVNIRVYERTGTDSNGYPIAGAVKFEGVTGNQGIVSGSLATGKYVLCMYDADGLAITRNGETVAVDLATSGSYALADCEPFTVNAGLVTSLVNPVELAEGVLNVQIYETVNGGRVPLAGIELCHGVYSPCQTTNARGELTFPGGPAGFVAVALQVDDMIIASAQGGLYTVSNIVVNEDGDPATADGVTFTYSPTFDVAQDGWAADVNGNALRGSYDVRIELERYVEPEPFTINFYLDCNNDGQLTLSDPRAVQVGSGHPCNIVSYTATMGGMELIAQGDANGTPILDSPYLFNNMGQLILNVGSGSGQVPAGSYDIYAVNDSAFDYYSTQPGYPTIDVVEGGTLDVLLTRYTPQNNATIQIVETTKPSEPANEVQWYRFSADATGTVFRFGFGANPNYTTDISAATQWDQFQDAINYLGTIQAGGGQVIVHPPQGQSPGDVIGTDEVEFSIEFVAGLGNTNVDPFTILIMNSGTRVMEYLDDSGTPNVQGSPGVDQVWTLNGVNITSGQWALTVIRDAIHVGTTINLNYDADAATIEAALNTALANLSQSAGINPAATATVTGGPVHTTPVIITIGGGLSQIGIDMMSLAGNTLS